MLGTPISDPMSGFFAMRRDRFDPIANQLAPVGFKILLDIVTTASHLRVAEEAYCFGARQEGESKFNVQVGLEFLGLLLARSAAVGLTRGSSFSRWSARADFSCISLR